MEQWQPVRVVWIDAHGGDVGWEEKDALEHKPYEVSTIGFLYQHDEIGVTVVMSLSDEQVGGYTFVPKVNIVTVEPLYPNSGA